MDCFYQLENALDSLNIRWQLRERVLNGEDIPSVLMTRDGKNINKEDYTINLKVELTDDNSIQVIEMDKKL